jgi:hypothetical protein
MQGVVKAYDPGSGEGAVLRYRFGGRGATSARRQAGTEEGERARKRRIDGGKRDDFI